MKYIIIVLFLALISQLSFAQESDSLNKDLQSETEIDSLEPVTNTPDTTTLQLGKKQVKIIEEDGETVVIIDEESEEIEDSEDDSDFKKEWDIDWGNDKSERKNKFKGHWAGFEFGLNNYVDQNFSLVRTTESEFLDLNTARSWNFNFNFSQYSIPVFSDRFGFVTGLGLEWSNYHFSNSNTIFKNTTIGSVEPLDITGSIKKNRLQTMYLTIPLTMELQLLKGNRKDRIHLAGGAIAGLKIYSKTKYKTYEAGGTRTEKESSDFYLSPFRYGLTARAGYKLVKVYFNYYLTPLFLENRGPELYPIAMGIALTF